MGDMIAIHQQAGTIQAYLSVPQKAAHFDGAVIIIHELWGLTEQIKRLADRVSTQGYYALAPDLYTTDKVDRRPSIELQNELFSSDERTRYNAMPKVRAMIAPTQTPQFKTLAMSRLESCFEYLYNLPLAHQKVMIMGFGFGAGYAFEMAMREQRLRGVMAFYGHSPRIAAELRHIHCPILGFYGQKEAALYKEMQKLLPRMEQAGVNFTPVVYNGVGHAFFNDDNSFSYSSGASSDAWKRCLTFMREHMALSN